MHFLLIPYLLLGSIFVVQFHGRKSVGMRSGAVVTAFITLLTLSIVIVFRPLEGDSWRYNQYFQVVRDLPLFEVIGYRDQDPLFALLNWVVGQFGSSPSLLFAGSLALYLGVSWVALRHRLTAVELSALAVAMVAYPFFVAYAANGLRQGIGLAFLFAGYMAVWEGRKSAWVWLLLAPLWHSAMWLAVSVLVLHQLMMKLVASQGARWLLVLSVWCGSVLMAVTGFNESIGGLLPGLVDLDANYEIYFMDANKFGYRAGFRPDFTLFSLLPLLTALALRRVAGTFDSRAHVGWMMSLYLSLNVIYHVFAFAPFADRFAAFSWWLMPFVVFLQVRATNSRTLMAVFVTTTMVVNAAMLQLYTGNFLPLPGWLS